MAGRMGEESRVEPCAICFDDVAAKDAVKLPCACKVTYCGNCWEQTMFCKTSCPTCRTHIEFDYDDNERKAKFVLADDHRPEKILLPDYQKPGSRLTNRFQRILVKEFRKKSHATQVQMLQECLGDNGQHRPCACGYGELRKVTLQERSSISDDKHTDFVCDCCGRQNINAQTADFIWTCDRKSVVHPTGYDICATCIEAPPED